MWAIALSPFAIARSRSLSIAEAIAREMLGFCAKWLFRHRNNRSYQPSASLSSPSLHLTTAPAATEFTDRQLLGPGLVWKLIEAWDRGAGLLGDARAASQAAEPEALTEIERALV